MALVAVVWVSENVPLGPLPGALKVTHTRAPDRPSSQAPGWGVGRMHG